MIYVDEYDPYLGFFWERSNIKFDEYAWSVKICILTYRDFYAEGIGTRPILSWDE